jgi:hypothetical protein
MDDLTTLRDAIDHRQRELAATVTPGALGLLVAATDGRPGPAVEDRGDPVTGLRTRDPGGPLALRLAAGAAPGGEAPPRSLPEAERFRDACADVALARVVADDLARGERRLSVGPDGSLTARLATRRGPRAWRELADFAWWDAHERRAGDWPPRSQLPYPADAPLGPLTARQWGAAIAWLDQERERLAPGQGPVPARIAAADLVAGLAGHLGAGTDAARAAIDLLADDPGGLGKDEGPPGLVPPPLVRLGGDAVLLSRQGLAAAPFLAVARAVRRADPRAWNDRARLREDAFRADLGALFTDRRFAVAPSPIRLRRDGGDLRTDVDAAIFDRKTGTLAIVELKSQDPFAPPGDREHEREARLLAGRQVGAALDWVNRHGADEILRRMDARAAKTFRVQRVLAFVLGHYRLPGDGEVPAGRAAWGTWPRFLRLAGETPMATGNPLLSLHTRLAQGTTAAAIPPGTVARTLDLGQLRLTVEPPAAPR